MFHPPTITHLQVTKSLAQREGVELSHQAICGFRTIRLKIFKNQKCEKINAFSTLINQKMQSSFNSLINTLCIVIDRYFESCRDLVCAFPMFNDVEFCNFQLLLHDMLSCYLETIFQMICRRCRLPGSSQKV